MNEKTPITSPAPDAQKEESTTESPQTAPKTEQSSQAPAKKSKKGLIIGLACGGCLLIVIIGAIAAYFVFGYLKKNISENINSFTSNLNIELEDALSNLNTDFIIDDINSNFNVISNTNSRSTNTNTSSGFINTNEELPIPPVNQPDTPGVNTVVNPDFTATFGIMTGDVFTETAELQGRVPDSFVTKINNINLQPGDVLTYNMYDAEGNLIVTAENSNVGQNDIFLTPFPSSSTEFYEFTILQNGVEMALGRIYQ